MSRHLPVLHPLRTRSRRRAWVGAALGLALAAAGGCGRESAARDQGSLARPAADEWVGPSVADFSMTDRSGDAITLADLRGSPFVLDFVFTTCAGPCPLMSAGMGELQHELDGTGVRLVSVTVDPETDTLEVLREYAARYDADAARWLFLRGDEQTLTDLASSVSLALKRDPTADVGFQVAHSTRLIVVDAEGRVRGYYEGTTPDGRAQAAARARWLDGR